MKLTSRRAVRPRQAAVAAAMLAVAAAAAAQAPGGAMPAPQPEAVFSIKGFAISGDNPLGSGETSAVLAPFLRSDATLEVLQRATAALEKALQDRGYSLYRVVLPPQALSDTVTLNVVRFSIGKVQLQGNGPHFDDSNVRAALPELREGESPNLRRLARETAVANENPSRQLVVSLKQVPEDESIQATVRVTEKAPWSAGVVWNNNGTHETGRDRLSLAASYNNLFNRDHVLGVAYTTSLDRPSHVKQIGLTYRAPLYALGGVLFASFSDSDVIGTFGVTGSGTEYGIFKSTAAGRTAKIGYAHYFVADGGFRSYATVAWEDKLYKGTTVDGVPLNRDRRSRPLTLSYLGMREAERQRTAYNAELAVNVTTGGANRVADYRTENADIDSVRWKAVRGGASVLRELPGGWQLLGRVQGQWSPDLLIAGEGFGLGGVGSVRGVPDRVLYGDSGLSGTLEAFSPQWVPGLRASAFVDAGAIRSHVTDRPERRRKDRLASVGMGLRYAHTSGASLSADYGYVVTGSRADSTENPSVPEKGDDKFHVSVSYTF